MGDEDPSLWDNEELLHGRRRDRRGNFQGKDPAVVPRQVYDEMVRRILLKVNNRMANALEDAVDTLVAIIQSTYTEDKDKLKAIDMLMNRVMGKTPEKIEVSAKRQPWEGLAVDAVVSVEADDIIDTTATSADDIYDDGHTEDYLDAEDDDE